MRDEIKKPELDKPKFFREPYDYRNMEKAGGFDGVGERGKVGQYQSNSLDAMPTEAKTIKVPRDHKG